MVARLQKLAGRVRIPRPRGIERALRHIPLEASHVHGARTETLITRSFDANHQAVRGHMHRVRDGGAHGENTHAPRVAQAAPKIDVRQYVARGVLAGATRPGGLWFLRDAPDAGALPIAARREIGCTIVAKRA